MLVKKKLPALLLSIASLFMLASAAPSFAQRWGGDGGPGGGPGGPMEHSFRGPEHGRWWDNPKVATQIGLTDDQKKKMDDILQEYRLQLIDLNAALEKQEVLLRPLIAADQPDETRVLSQIDAIAAARANLEKANARMLFDNRKVLTPDQWKKLKTLVQARMADRGMGRGMDSGGRGWDGHRSGGGPGGPGGPGNGPGGNPPPTPPQDGPSNQ